MVVPTALVLGVGEQGMLQQVKVALDFRQWNHIYFVSQIFVNSRHQLATVVPGRKVGEVFPDKSFRKVAFRLHELFHDLSGFGAVQDSLPDLLLIKQHNPEAVVPAVEVALIQLQHLVAKLQLDLEDLASPLNLCLLDRGFCALILG